MLILTGQMKYTPPPASINNVPREPCKEMAPRVPKPFVHKGVKTQPLGQINRQKILDTLADGGRWTAQDMGDEIELSQTATRRHLIKMVDTGLVLQSDKNPKDSLSKTEYWLNDSPR